MSIIIRLQNLPWSANSVDIRRYFQGLSIPEGGVHIVGGEKGDAFIAFSTDEDARQAMEKDGGKIKEIRIKLLLSSRTEMQRVIEQARNQNLVIQPAVAAQPVPAPPPPPPPPAPAPTQKSSKETERRRTTERSRSPERRRDRDKSPADRERSSRRSSRRDRSRSRSPRRSRDRERERHGDRSSKRDERRRSEEVSKSSRDEDVRTLPTAEQVVPRDRDIDKRQPLPNGDMGTPLPDMRAISAYPANETPLTNATPAPNYPSVNAANYPPLLGDRNRLAERTGIPISRDYELPKQTDPHWNAPFPSADTKKDIWDDNRRGLLAPPSYEQHEKIYPTDKRNFLPEPAVPRGRYIDASEPAEIKYPPYSTQPVYDSHSNRERQENANSLLPRPVPPHRDDFDSFRDSKARTGDSATSRFEDPRTVSAPMSERSQINRDLHGTQHPDSAYDLYPSSRPSVCVELHGMPYNVNYKDVREFFRGLYIPADGLKLVNDENGHRTGLGFVRFSNDHDATEAVKRSGQYMGQYYIEVRKCPEEAFGKAVDSFVPVNSRKPAPSVPLLSRLPPKEDDLCILLKGLPYQCKEDDIISFFDGLGILDILIEYDHNGRAIGTGFVEFSTFADFQAAMNMNRETIGHRYIELSVASKDMMNEARKNSAYGRSAGPVVDPPRPLTAPPKELLPLPISSNETQSPFCVLLQNLPYDVTDRDIADFFAGVGVVPRAIHIMLGPNGMPYGDAFAEFSNTQEFDRALKKNGQFVGPLVVTVKPVPYSEMIEILGGPAPRNEPLLDKPLELRDRAVDNRRLLPSLLDKRLGPLDRQLDHPPERRMEHHLSSDRRIDHPISSDRRLDHPLPSDRRLDRPAPSDRRMDHSLSSDRRMDHHPPPSDRRMDHPLPPDRRLDHPTHPERRTDHPPDRRAEHLPLSDRHMDRPSSSERRLDHSLPIDRSLDRSSSAERIADHSDRRLDGVSLLDKRLGPPHSERRLGVLERQSGQPLPHSDRRSINSPSDRRMGPSQEKRPSHSDRRIPIPPSSDRHLLSDNIDEKPKGSESKSSKKNVATDRKDNEETKFSTEVSEKGEHGENDPPTEKRRHLMEPPKGWSPNERERTSIRPLLDPDERTFIPTPPGPDIHPRGPSHRPELRGHMQRPPRMPRGPHIVPDRMRPPFLMGPEGFGKPGCVVAVTNMAYQAGVEDILSFFKGFELGKEDVIRRFNERGQPTGEARISFQTPQDAQRAVQELNRRTLSGRPINLYLV